MCGGGGGGLSLPERIRVQRVTPVFFFFFFFFLGGGGGEGFGIHRSKQEVTNVAAFLNNYRNNREMYP